MNRPLVTSLLLLVLLSFSGRASAEVQLSPLFGFAIQTNSNKFYSDQVLALDLSGNSAAGLDAVFGRLPVGCRVILSYWHAGTVGIHSDATCMATGDSYGIGVARAARIGMGSLEFSAGYIHVHSSYSAESQLAQPVEMLDDQSGLLVGLRLSAPLSDQFDLAAVCKVQAISAFHGAATTENDEIITVDAAGTVMVFAVGFNWRVGGR